MQITLSIIENNPRRNGEAVINGLQVDIVDANLTGSEKQVAWASGIMADALREAARAALKLNGIDTKAACVDAAALDAAVAKVNAMMQELLAGRLAGGSAAKWIDNRYMGARELLNTMAEG